MLGLAGWIAGGCSTAADFPAVVVTVAEELERERLIYSSRPQDLRDCSGIFHRALARLQDRCPEVAGPDAGSRSSQAIARWYAEHGKLETIKDPLDQDDAIRPGVALFYGSRPRRRRSSREQILGHVVHVGIVTAVERDARGRVVSYRLFHGRSGRKPAAITAYHTREPTRKGYPPLGNGQQHWLAVAELCRGHCRCR